MPDCHREEHPPAVLVLGWRADMSAQRDSREWFHFDEGDEAS